jgi:hypothetical protein
VRRSVSSSQTQSKVKASRYGKQQSIFLSSLLLPNSFPSFERKEKEKEKERERKKLDWEIQKHPCPVLNQVFWMILHTSGHTTDAAHLTKGCFVAGNLQFGHIRP